MIAFGLCLFALLTTLHQTRRATVRGLIAVLGWGYFFGILRANFSSSASYFIFDASLVGFYIASAKSILNDASARTVTLRIWVALLILWPCFICSLPFQDFLVSLVGLRGNVFFVPMLLVGAQLANRDLTQLSKALALLNITTLGFALGEYFVGVTRFYPENAATAIIYASNDVAGYAYHRIPATFITAHVYGGTMAASLPLLFGCWAVSGESARTKLLMLLGMAAAVLGILLSATRLNFIIGALVMVGVLLSRGVSAKKKLAVVIVMTAVAVLASSNERMSRFKSLGNGQGVIGRIGGSVNRDFWDIISEYPMGNGLGGGGTSIPFFLADRIHRPVMIENEYGRIALELGLPGLALWLAFAAWFMVPSQAFANCNWRSGRIVTWCYCCLQFFIAPIGTGLFTTAPGSAMIFLFMGWVATKQRLGEDEALLRESPHRAKIVLPQSSKQFELLVGPGSR